MLQCGNRHIRERTTVRDQSWLMIDHGFLAHAALRLAHGQLWPQMSRVRNTQTDSVPSRVQSSAPGALSTRPSSASTACVLSPNLGGGPDTPPCVRENQVGTPGKRMGP
jgi:hypothetical protein